MLFKHTMYGTRGSFIQPLLLKPCRVAAQHIWKNLLFKAHFLLQIPVLWWDPASSWQCSRHSIRGQEVHRSIFGASLCSVPGDESECKECVYSAESEPSVWGARPDGTVLGGDRCAGRGGPRLWLFHWHRLQHARKCSPQRNSQCQRSGHFQCCWSMGWGWMPA